MELVVQDVSKSYQQGRKVALDQFTSVFTPGIYGILGPNGAGKSTLMNLITNQLQPDTGHIMYKGKSIQALGRDYRNILGYMPQQQGVLEDFTGRRFLWYMAALKGLSAKETKLKVEELLSIVNLVDDADRNIRTYSGGMKQRILIAQALLNDPDIIILDEPTAGVDPNERIRLRNFISTIATNKIVLLATHVVSDIEFITKEVILLKEGKRIKQESPMDIAASLEGKVFEAIIPQEQLADIQAQYKVSNIMTTTEGLNVRFIQDGDSPPDVAKAQEVSPHLEDVYLYYFA